MECLERLRDIAASVLLLKVEDINYKENRRGREEKTRIKLNFFAIRVLHRTKTRSWW